MNRGVDVYLFEWQASTLIRQLNRVHARPVCREHPWGGYWWAEGSVEGIVVDIPVGRPGVPVRSCGCPWPVFEMLSTWEEVVAYLQQEVDKVLL